jgi:hypothetical protein
MKKSIICLVIIASSFAAFSQPYQLGGGLRFDYNLGLDVKYFVNSNAALCGILGFGNGLALTGLYEIHKTLDIKNLYFYYGGGGHVMNNGYNYFDSRYYVGPSVGINGVVGFEYILKDIPLSLALDLMPIIDTNIGFDLFLGITARYLFKK